MAALLDNLTEHIPPIASVLLGMLFVLMAAATVFMIWSCSFSPVHDIPGPFLAYVGTCWPLWHVAKGDWEFAVLALHKKYGPFVRISYNEVSVNHVDGIHSILGAPLAKSSFYSLFAIPNSNYQNIMSTRDHKLHLRHKANLMPGLTMAATMKNEPHIDDALETLIAKISPTSGPSADDLAANGETKIEGKLVDLKSWISFFTYDVLGEAMFSKRFGFLVEGRDIGNSISITFKLALYVTLAAYAQWVHWLFLGSPILRWIDFQPSLHIFDRATDAIKERKANPEMAHADMMGQWMAQLQKHPERMEEKEILCAVLGGLSAGGETISGTLQVFFNMLLRHPEHYRRLTDELLEAQAKGKLSKIVTYAEAQTLPFLQACLKEAIRIYPVVSWNLPRDVPRAGLTVAGKFFEPGTVLSVNPFVIHHNPEIFGDDASEYNPYRWLNAEKGKHLDGYILTFGYGSRLCVGKSLALLELNKFTATLVRDFEMRLPDPSRKWRSHSLFVTVFPDWSCYMTPRRHGTSEYRNAREEKRI